MQPDPNGTAQAPQGIPEPGSDSHLSNGEAEPWPVVSAEWRLTAFGITGHFHVNTPTRDEAMALGRRLDCEWRVEWRPVGQWQPDGPRLRTRIEAIDSIPGDDACQAP